MELTIEEERTLFEGITDINIKEELEEQNTASQNYGMQNYINPNNSNGIKINHPNREYENYPILVPQIQMNKTIIPNKQTNAGVVTKKPTFRIVYRNPHVNEVTSTKGKDMQINPTIQVNNSAISAPKKVMKRRLEVEQGEENGQEICITKEYRQYDITQKLQKENEQLRIALNASTKVGKKYKFMCEQAFADLRHNLETIKKLRDQLWYSQ